MLTFQGETSFTHATLFQVKHLNILLTHFQLDHRIQVSNDIFLERQLVCCAFCETWPSLLYIIQMSLEFSTDKKNG